MPPGLWCLGLVSIRVLFQGAPFAPGLLKLGGARCELKIVVKPMTGDGGQGPCRGFTDHTVIGKSEFHVFGQAEIASQTVFDTLNRSLRA